MHDPILYRSRYKSSHTLAQAIAIFTRLYGNAVGLVYGRHCRFILADRSGTTTNQTGIDLLDDVWEARLFNPGAELRWLQTDADATHRFGQCALIHDDPCESPELATKPLAYSALLAQTGLFWGAVDAEASGDTASSDRKEWQCLKSGQIGTLWVPCGPIGHDHTPILRSQEYVSHPDEHGNVAIIEQRLLDVSVVKTSVVTRKL